MLSIPSPEACHPVMSAVLLEAWGVVPKKIAQKVELYWIIICGFKSRGCEKGRAIHDSIHIFIFAQLLFGLYISGGSCRKQLVDRLAAQVRQVPAPSVLVRCRPQTMTGSRTRSAGTGCWEAPPSLWVQQYREYRVLLWRKRTEQTEKNKLDNQNQEKTK